jgi:MerR family transcriptional regulator, copper efflux regulator
MTQPTPAPALACSLSSAEGAERAARWRTLLDAGLLSRTATTAGQRLAFSSDPDVAGELDALVAAEQDCCPFLHLTVERFDDTLVLDISGPPDAADIVATMFGSAP